MGNRVFRSFREPRRAGLSWRERWQGDDKGLITSWEVGRELRSKEPELARCAENGELPVLAWKGGVEKATKKGEKFGVLCYLAQWQGLKGEDLDIDPSQEPVKICSRTGMRVTFTADIAKYGDA